MKEGDTVVVGEVLTSTPYCSILPFCDVSTDGWCGGSVQMEFNWIDSDDMRSLGDWKRGTRGTKVWPH